MAEGNTEYPIGNNARFEEIVTGEFDNNSRIQTMAIFDASRLAIYEQFADVADQMSNPTSEQPILQINYVTLTEGLRAAITDILEDDQDMGENLQLVVETIRTDYEDRYDELNEILDDIVFDTPEHEQIEAFVLKTAAKSETYHQTIENIIRRYVDDLEHDVRAFTSLLFEIHGREDHVHDESTEPSTLEIKKEFKDHVTDVAKIVAGVTIALAVDKLLKRKN